MITVFSQQIRMDVSSVVENNNLLSLFISGFQIQYNLVIPEVQRPPGTYDGIQISWPRIQNF